MPLFAGPFTVGKYLSSSVTYRSTLRTAPSARAERPVADDAHDVRVKVRIDAMDANRPDYDAVPEHDPDGTPWAA